MARLTDGQLAILEHLREHDEYQINTWALPAELQPHIHELPRLKRRGLVDGEGQGRSRQWWITDEGEAVLP